MLLRNNSKRLITINGTLDTKNGRYPKAYQIKPGNNPAVEVPDDLCGSSFVKGLIESGDLIALTQGAAAPTSEPEHTDELDAMTKADLQALAETMDIEVAERWTKAQLIDAIRSAAQ